ncbi:M23 family metallopeptidase [Flavobacterium sp. F52]|uniref:M23 family metallopeptidase n=1 Tax=Flavobacterium sp. F52 TaxID=1202532 RepID=UPI000272D838|nr:M23 family metallopeptidase [Flavobacterium sp. F52]EJG03527.1 peptidase M23 [Flavobacterium sp. F52]
MNRNTVHNFNILIKNNSSLESSEDLTKSFIKELAQVSKEINEQKDIVQIWQEQNASNNVMNNTLDSAGEGVFDTNAAIKTVPSFSNTSSAPRSNLFPGSTLNASIGGGAFDSTESTIMSSFGSTGNTLPVSEAENTVLSNAFSQIYESIDTKQMLIVPQMLQSNNNEPSMELIKAEIKKKLDQAIKENNPEAIQYWTRISKAFDDEKTAVADFVDKPNEMLFTEMYNALKQMTETSAEVQNFNWNVVCKKMIKAIEANILKGSISKAAKSRWETIKKQLADDKTNVANLFERYDELFLLLKEVEGLDALPNSITITTKTKIYPNLSADRLYASIGKEDVYVFLKQVNETDLDGSGVNKGAVKIKNANATSFIVGESLEFFVDEAFINQKVNQKENINWIVYNITTDSDNIFENEGTSFSYNFDTPGTYRIDAYGKKHTVKQKKSAATATFIELKIVAQDIIITPPAIAKAEFIRPFAEEKTFKVSLKNKAIKTLNPMKLYYQIETVVGGKNAVISEERELDSTGIIKLAMRDLGIYKIKVNSKDQYGLNKEFKTSVIKNEVTSIGHVKDTPKKNVFLLGNPSNALTLEAKTFKINPPTDTEKKDVKWIIHDSNNKLYVPDGEVIINENKDPQKPYIHKWDFYDVPIPQKIGFYKIEAYCNDKKGPKDGVTFKMEVKQPEITEAYWAWRGGSKKTISGLLESNWINASIPYYNNQTVRIYFYLGNAKTNHYIDVKTNSKGEIFEEVKFDATFQKAIGLGRKKNAKIGFKLLGIQNSKPYPFKSPANYDANTTLSLTADKKVLDVYFTYDGNRVTPEDEVPFGKKGAIVTIVAKTQNMIGEEVTLSAHKVSEKPSFAGKATVNSEGVATTSFLLKNLDKKLKLGSKINYYAGVEGYSTKHLVNKVLVMIVGEGNKDKNNNKIIDENDPQLIWGSKVSKEFRVKVVKIAKKLKVDPNWIMIIIAKETSLTFDPHIDNGIGYVGLIQFSEASAEQVGTTHAELKKMTAVTQLNYVEKRFEKLGKNGYKSLTDLYLAVLQPTSVGQGDKDGNILWTSNRMAYYNNPSYHKEKGEYDNKIIKSGKTKRGFEEGTTFMWEVREELERIKNEGEKFEKVLKALPLNLKYKNWTLNQITSGYGKRDVQVGSKFHKGLDFNYSGGGDTDIGAPVFSTHDGFIYSLKDDASGNTGRYLIIRSEDNLFQTRYLHLSKIVVKKDEKIKKGQKIGELGASYNGKEKGGDISAHLHYEIMKLEGKKSEKTYTQIDPTEGHGKNKDYLIDPQDWIK